jgi:hypothetical protein
MRRRVIAVACLVVVACVACASSSVLDDFIAGWQSQKDGYVHDFVHRSFLEQRKVADERAKLVQSGAVEWSSYARRILATATLARAITEAKGRAQMLERFLEHMQAAPGADATTDWFSASAAELRQSARNTGARTEDLVRELGSPLAITVAALERVELQAAAQGQARGEALQLADLRGSAGLYYGRIGYDPTALGFLAGGAGAGTGEARQDPLVGAVEQESGWAALRQAILQPRSCAHTTGAVVCTKLSEAEAQAVRAAAPPPVPPAAGEAARPVEDLGDFRPRVFAPDLLDRRPGW